MRSVESSRVRDIYRVTIVGSIVNALLAVGKLLAGILGHSGAMVADAVHSISDFATDIVVLVFVKLSSKPKDETHDYGHGKYETLATVIIGLALFAVAVGIFINSAEKIGRVIKGEIIERPGLVVLLAAAISILCKEGLYWYTVAVGRRVNSSVVIANAWHHRSDALSSIGTLVGIGGARFLGEQWRVLDPIAAIVVGALIVKVAYDLIAPGLGELVDKSLPKDVEQQMIDVILEDGEVHDPHNLKTRRIGSYMAVEVHIRLDGEMSVNHSHSITVGIERRLKERFGADLQVIIHVEPIKRPNM